MLLLRAALLNGSESRRAASAWFDEHSPKAGEGFRYLDSASRRLLPLVLRNVKDAIPAQLRNEVRNVHRECWADNQRLFQKLEAVLLRLRAAGVPTLVLKGAALSILHYRDMAVRPMSDFDILVPEEFGPQLLRQFVEEGWLPDCVPKSGPRTDYFYRYRHALDLVHPDKGTVDLHWHVLLEATYRGADRHFWEGSIPVQVKSVPTLALNPTDQLLHTLLHGFPYNPMPSIRWIADAITILRTGTTDWDRLLRVAGDLRVTIPCAEALTFLNREFAAGVPDSAVGKLAAHSVSTSEARYFQRMAHPGARRWWETMEDVWTATIRANRDRSFPHCLAALPRQLQMQQELESLSGLIPHVFVFLKRRFV